MSSTHNTKSDQGIREKVRQGYAAIAVQTPKVNEESCCAGTSCCGADAADDATALASAIGYAEQDLKGLPEGANMGLSCGNPTAIAALKDGEVVVDLGSGGGFDIFIAGGKVGATGRAIGIDMTSEMLSKARRNAEKYQARTGLDNVEFRLGEIEHLPVADNSVDVVISNCVINLSPNKEQVWREMYRILKPGGRVAVSDMALVQPLPENVASMVEALVGCVSGAVLISETEQMATEAGFSNISLVQKDNYSAAMTKWNDPLYAEIIAGLPEGAELSQYVTSLDVSARKAS